MIRTIEATYTREDRISFIIDDDKEMRWLSTWNTKKYDKVFVIIDENVNKIWGKFLLKRLPKNKKQRIILFTVVPQESSKSILFYPKLVEFLEENNCNLSDLVIAVGGGVVLDLVGFTCSTYMRGVAFSAIPTTLIGMTDASSAGKTCLNTMDTKNILGTFYYPEVVYNNINFLQTCPPYYHRQGLSEVFKYGLLGSPSLLYYLRKYNEARSGNLLKKIISLTIETRIKIRKIHPQASNLGHTFGQALEKLSEYNVLHGDAISVGTVLALNFGVEQKIMTPKNADRVINLMKELHLNLYIEKNIDINKMVDIMMHDKKSTGTHLNLVLLRDINQPYKDERGYFYQTEPTTVIGFLREFLKKYPYILEDTANFIKKDTLVYEDN